MAEKTELPVLVFPVSRPPCRWHLSGTDGKLQTPAAFAHATEMSVKHRNIQCGILGLGIEMGIDWKSEG